MDSHSELRWRLSHSCLLLVVALLAFLLAGCAQGDYRAVRVDVGHASAIRLSPLWDQIAASGRFDPETAELHSLRLEYSGAGTLVSAQMQAFTFQNESVQVGFTNYDHPGDDSVHVTGGVSSVYRVPSYPLPPAPRLFAAIDAVSPGAMIGLLPSTGSNGRYVFTFAPLKTVPPSEPAYFWDGSRFGSLASDDSRRAFSSDCVYVFAYSAFAVSSSDSPGSDTAASVYQSSGPPVYFVIPISSL